MKQGIFWLIIFVVFSMHHWVNWHWRWISINISLLSMSSIVSIKLFCYSVGQININNFVAPININRKRLLNSKLCLVVVAVNKCFGMNFCFGLRFWVSNFFLSWIKLCNCDILLQWKQLTSIHFRNKIFKTGMLA